MVKFANNFKLQIIFVFVFLFHISDAGIGLLPAHSQSNSSSIRITSPDNGNSVSGNVILRARVESSRSNLSVQFYIDGNSIGNSDRRSPNRISLNSNNFTNGTHSILAVLRRSNNTIARSQTVSININNNPQAENPVEEPEEPTENPVEEPNSADFPRMTDAELNPAINGKNAYFTGEKNGGNAVDRGALIFEAMDAYSGSTRSDAKLLANLHDLVSVANHDPSAAGGFVAQMEAFYACAIAVASKTPRIWNAISSTDKAKHDLLMTGLVVSSAYLSSSTNHFIAGRLHNAKALRGQQDYPRTGSPNYINGTHAIMIAAATYFGTARVNTILNGFDANALSRFRQDLSANNLRNMAETFELDVAGAPTDQQLISATKNWESGRFDLGISNPFALWIGTVDYAHKKNITSGLNNGAGVRGPLGTMRGKIVRNAASLPNVGQSGMLVGFDGSDASGPRSSAQYAIFDARPSLYSLAALIAGGFVDRSNSTVQAAIAKMNRGWIDLKFKTDNGYYDYSHAGAKGPNSNWPDNPARWGIVQNLGLFRVLKEYVEAD